MAENTQLDVGTGGDTIRSHDRAGVKTQVVALDLNPAGSEILMAGVLPVSQSGTWSVVVSSLPAVTLSGTPAVTISGTVPVSGTFWQSTQPVALADGANATLGAQADVAAGTDTGTFSLLALFKRLLSRVTTLLGQLPAALTGGGNLKTALVESTVTQAVSGTVAVSNFPATQPVSGTFWQTTQPVSGTVAVSNFPATQPVSGTVTANAGSGTFPNQQSNVTLDYDTGAGTQTTTVFGLALPASGGAVAGGTVTNPLRTDPTGTTTQPVSGAITANAGTNLNTSALALETGGNLASLVAVEGATADALVAAGATGSISAKLRRVTQGLEDLKSLLVLAAGSNTIGSVNQAGTWNVDTELPAGAALADGAAAGLTTVTVGAVGLVMGATTLDRRRAVVAGLNSVGTGIAAAGLVGQLDDVSPSAVSEDQFAPLRISSRRALRVEGVTGGDPQPTNVTQWGGVALPPAVVLTDGLTLPTAGTLGAVSLLYNGATTDVERGTYAAVGLTLASRTANAAPPVIQNPSARGVALYLNVTAVPAVPGSGGLSITIFDPDLFGNLFTLFQDTPPVTVAGPYAYYFYPGIITETNTAPGVRIRRSVVVGRQVYLAVIHLDAQAYTYSLGYTLLR